MRSIYTLLTMLIFLVQLAPSAVAENVWVDWTRSSNFYGLRTLGERAFAYSDRDYVFANVHGCLQNRQYLVTPNQDKFSREPELVAIRTDRPVTVYVGYDSRYQTRPDWLLQNYDPVPFFLNVVDPRTEHQILAFQMYRSRFPQDQIRLGGNIAPQENNNFAMYTAIFVDAQQDYCPKN